MSEPNKKRMAITAAIAQPIRSSRCLRSATAPATAIAAIPATAPNPTAEAIN